MNIELNDQEIQEGINKSATEAVKNALKGYNVNKAIEDMVSNVIVNEVMANAIAEAAGKIDIKAMSDAMAKEIAKSTVSAVQLVIRDSLMSTILKIRGVPEYDHDKRKVAIEQIKLDLAGLK